MNRPSRLQFESIRLGPTMIRDKPLTKGCVNFIYPSFSNCKEHGVYFYEFYLLPPLNRQLPGKGRSTLVVFLGELTSRRGITGPNQKTVGHGVCCRTGVRVPYGKLSPSPVWVRSVSLKSIVVE